jgi:glyoxalase family protein
MNSNTTRSRTPPTASRPTTSAIAGAAVVRGLHHITAIAGDARANVRFYRDVLGLRFVKRTVNFDDPGTYHLYYGDTVGHPGTAITFFPWGALPPGRRGSGEQGATSYAVPRGSLPFWRTRLEAAGHVVTDGGRRFGDGVLAFHDESGSALELIEADGDGAALRPWTGNGVGVAEAIRGFHAPTLVVAEAGPTLAVLRDVLGFRERRTEAGRTRLVAPERAGPGYEVDVVADPSLPRARQGRGSVHHLAFRVPDDATHERVRAAVAAAGHLVTEVIDRNYFHSIYFREPGGILFEVATDQPGFTVDEPEAELGRHLRLPVQHEHLRAQLERHLPALD